MSRRWQGDDGPRYGLEEPCEVTFEYRGPQRGHPSSYGSVSIAATSAADLEIEITAELPPAERSSLARAVRRAAFDELIAGDGYAFRGCKLNIYAIGWDDVMSSEVTLYRATRGALSKLRADGDWELRDKIG